MRFNKILVGLTATAAVLLTGCTLEPYVITPEEEYTRSFIKTFGLIDSNQDWNLAENTAVTVMVGDTPSQVKAYMKVDGTYYLVANIEHASGTVKVPFDMPEGTEDILVKINGKRYYTTPGGTVDPYNYTAPGSRSVFVNGTGEGGSQNGVTYAQYTTTSNINGKAVTVVASNTNNYTYFNALQLGPITSKEVWPDFYSVLLDDYVTNTGANTGILPEIDEGGAKAANISNYSSKFINNNIYDDFVFDSDEVDGKSHFTMYPMYWMTSQNPTTLGVYIIDPSDNKIHKFPVYSTKRFDGDIEEYYPEGHYYTQSESTSGSGTGTAEVTDGLASGDTGGGDDDTPVIITATEISCRLYVDLTENAYSPKHNLGGIDIWNTGCFKVEQKDGVNIGHINKATLEAVIKSKVSTIDGFKAWYKPYSDSTPPVSEDDFTKIPENSLLDSDYRYKLSSLVSTSVDGASTWEGTATFVLDDGASRAKVQSRTSEGYTVNKDLVTAAKASNRWGKPYGWWDSYMYDCTKEMLLRSRGVDITIDGFEGEFGMYIEYGDITLYSQKAYNEKYAGDIRYPNDEKGREVYGEKAGTLASSFAASYLHPISKQLYFSFEDWTDSGSDGDLNDLIFMFSGVTKIITPNKKVTIEEEKDEPYQWLLAIEDLGATDDFDFNDIVVGISAVTCDNVPDGARIVGSTPVEGLYKKVTYTALAAGGTKAAYLFYHGEALYPDGKENCAEWHQWFGNGFYSTTMINTGNGVDNQPGAKCTIYYGSNDGVTSLFTLDNLLGKTGTMDAHNSGFRVGIDNAENTSSTTISTDYFTKGDDGYFVKPAGAGEAPQMFLIPDNWTQDGKKCSWQWPTERTHIQDSYTRFSQWVSTPTKNADWYKYTGNNVCRPTGGK